MARKSKYETTIPPNMELIKGWISEGVPERLIAENLGVAYSTWRRWVKDNEQLSAIISTGRRPRVEELENTMFELAKGMIIPVTKGMKVRNSDGSESVEEYTETVFVPPNFNALRFLLTNWSEKYSNDPALMRQREKEFEHKKKIDELNNW